VFPFLKDESLCNVSGKGTRGRTTNTADMQFCKINVIVLSYPTAKTQQMSDELAKVRD
jgi:hypothetical protein